MQLYTIHHRVRQKSDLRRNKMTVLSHVAKSPTFCVLQRVNYLHVGYLNTMLLSLCRVCLRGFPFIDLLELCFLKNYPLTRPHFFSEVVVAADYAARPQATCSAPSIVRTRPRTLPRRREWQCCNK